MQLQPLRYQYRDNNAVGIQSNGEHIGFSAQAVQKVIPEAVTSTSSGYLMVNNDPIIWTMLNAIKEQQKQIDDLKQEVQRLRAKRTTSRRRR
jgi:peptidoglycan hydrolase CwlO-like protein